MTSIPVAEEELGRAGRNDSEDGRIDLAGGLLDAQFE
jgi:hypothetical protein